MRRIEAECSEIAECSGHFAAIGGAERVAVIFNEPQIVAPAEFADFVEIERVAEGVSDKDRFGFGRQRQFQFIRVDIAVGQNVHKYWYCAELHNGSYGGGESGGHADNFVAALNAPFA